MNIKTESSDSPDSLLESIDPDRIHKELIEQLYRSGTMTLLSSFAAATLISYVFWMSVDPDGLWVWYALSVGWTFLRFVMLRVVLSGGIDRGNAIRAERLFVFGSGVAGVIWGCSVLLATQLAPATELLVVPCVMAALSTSAIVGYTRSLPAFAAFIIPSLLPYSIRLVWLDGMVEPMMAGFVLFWGVLLGVIARHMSGGIRNRIALAIRNTELIESLTRARDRAESASLSKTRFLANMSHELRTPLNAILGYSEMMQIRSLGPQDFGKYDGYPANIYTSGEHLLRIVDQVLDVSKLEAGAIDLSNDLIHLPGLIGKSVAFVAPTAEQDGVAIEVSYPEQLPCLRGDATKIRQILLNLLSNAVKFTPQGGSVTVTVEILRDGRLEISIRDTGIGMSTQDMDQILTPFARMENREHLALVKAFKPDRGQTNTGLGLPLSKLLCDLHEADLELVSTPQVGTEVLIRFPEKRVVYGDNVTLISAVS